MEVREFTKSGAFVAIVFALVVVLFPFALEQIGDATGLFAFPARKTVAGWFSFGRAELPRDRIVAKSVDWEVFRKDLESFTMWAEGRSVAAITLPPPEIEFRVEEKELPPVRELWSVPVVSCTAAHPSGQKKGYVFISGFDHPFEEGSSIAPTDVLCGYEIVHVGERSVWFKAAFGGEGETPMGSMKFPEFSRVDGDCLVRGTRRYGERDAFPLPSGGWLLLDSFMPPDGAVFKILDERRRPVATLLCIVIGEKGGR